MVTITPVQAITTSAVSGVDKAPQSVETKNVSAVEESTAPAEAAKPAVESSETQLPSHITAALAKKERALRAQVRELQSKEQALLQREAEIENARTWKERLTQDTLGVLGEAGIDYDQLTTAILNQNNPQDIKLQALQREIMELKKLNDVNSQRAQEQTKLQYEQAKKQIRREVDSLVIADTAFEGIKESQAQEAVVDLIEATFNDEGYIMDVYEAAKVIEDALFEDFQRLHKVQGFQKRIAPPPAPEPIQQQPTIQKQASHSTTTLSNRMVPSTAKTQTEVSRRERALRAFMGQLS